ncbi:Golgi apyrase [Mortierella sp. GBA30]|nr:Golgi apyrase [Mortierella sp. GBA30]
MASLHSEAWLQHRQFGIVIDAGSSGSRLHIYSWINRSFLQENVPRNDFVGTLPTIEPGVQSGAPNSEDWSMRVEPADFKERPEDVGEHLEPMLDHALKIIPESEIQHTPIYLLATAGLRLVQEDIRLQILAETCRYIKDNYSFQIGECKDHIKNITGEEEGIYGWVAINYLMGGFDNGGVKMLKPPPSTSGSVEKDVALGEEGADEGKDSAPHRHTLGFLDMGGASTQIAFEPSTQASREHANDLMAVSLRTLDGQMLEYNVFVTTFLGYGSNQARRRYVKDYLLSNNKELLEAAKPGDPISIDDPCLPKHLKLSETHTMPHVPLQGSGSFTECLKRVEVLLNKDKECHDEPCLFNGVHTPPIDFNINTFIGVSEYWYSTHDILGLGGAYDYAEFERKSAEFCESEWDDIKDRPEYQGQSQDRLEMQCFKSAWLSNVLHGGFGLPRYGEKDAIGSQEQSKEVLEKAGQSIKNKNWRPPFQSINAIKEIQVTWTLGAMLLISSGRLGPPGSAGSGGLAGGDRVHSPTHQILPPPDQKPPHEDTYPERMLDSYNHFMLLAIVLFAMALFCIYRSRSSKSWSFIKRWLGSSVSSPSGHGSHGGGDGFHFFRRFRSASRPSTMDYSSLESGTAGSTSYGRGFSPRASLKVFYLSVVHHTRSVWWSLTSRIWPEPTSFDPLDGRAEEMIESITIAGYDGSANTTTTIPMSNAVGHHGGTPGGSFGSSGLSAIPEGSNGSPGVFEPGYHRSNSSQSSRPPKTAPKFFRMNKKRFSGDSHSLFPGKDGRGNQVPVEGCVINTALLQKAPKNSVELTARSGSSTNLTGLWSGVGTPNAINNPTYLNSGNTTPATANSTADPHHHSQLQPLAAWKQGWIPEEDPEDVPMPSILTSSRNYSSASINNGQGPLLMPMARYKQQQLIHQDGSSSAPSSTVNLGIMAAGAGIGASPSGFASGFVTSADEREDWSADGGDGDDEGDGFMARHHYSHSTTTTHHSNQSLSQQQYHQQTVQYNQQQYSQQPVRSASAIPFSSTGSTGGIAMGSRYKQRSTGLLSGTNFETGGGAMTALDGNDSAGETGYLSGSSSVSHTQHQHRRPQIQTSGLLPGAGGSIAVAGVGSRSASPMMVNQQQNSTSTSSLVLGRHNVSEQDQQLVSRGSSENLRRGSMGALLSP